MAAVNEALGIGADHESDVLVQLLRLIGHVLQRLQSAAVVDAHVVQVDNDLLRVLTHVHEARLEQFRAAEEQRARHGVMRDFFRHAVVPAALDHLHTCMHARHARCRLHIIAGGENTYTHDSK